MKLVDMRLVNVVTPIILLSCIVLHSCIEEPVRVDENKSGEKVSIKYPVITRSTATEGYEILPNPYALEVMQEVYDIYGETPVTLAATDLYVKFMPKDSAELYTLRYDYDLELFDYPLDIELEEGEVYVNPNLPEDDLVWVYTTVRPDFVFPDDISYEVLEECYIPEDGETVGIPTKAGEVNVEDAAFALMVYDEEPSLDTRAVARPQGTIMVHDNSTTTVRWEPVKGVKVRCHRLVKWATAYTDENGLYVMSKSFRFKPHYAVVFENVKDFDIWGNYGNIALANYNMGWRSNTGHSVNFASDNYAWQWAAINNAAYDYYQMCEQTGILKPPPELKIWVWNDFCGSSAPMLRRIAHAIGFNTSIDILNLFVNVFYGMPATLLNQVLKKLLPDVTIGLLDQLGNRLLYSDLYNTVNHELAHASHFSQVGSEYWAQYISYIMTYGAYGGNDSGYNAQLCAVGEMWGNFMGYIQEHENCTIPLSNIHDVDGWIYPQLFINMYNNGVLSKKQIFDCLTVDVDTYNKLLLKMYSMYPDKTLDIKQGFNSFPGIKKHTILSGDAQYDAFCVYMSINSSHTISGENILVENSVVKSGATLLLKAGTSIEINQPFTLENGARMIMAKGDEVNDY